MKKKLIAIAAVFLVGMALSAQSASASIFQCHPWERICKTMPVVISPENNLPASNDSNKPFDQIGNDAADLFHQNNPAPPKPPTETPSITTGADKPEKPETNTNTNTAPSTVDEACPC